jgi:hypothetical protein
MIERMDQGVGEVLAQLDHMGAAENTLIVFASDNGAIRVGNNTPFRGFKSSVWEAGFECLAWHACRVSFPGEAPFPKLRWEWTGFQQFWTQRAFHFLREESGRRRSRFRSEAD